MLYRRVRVFNVCVSIRVWMCYIVKLLLVITRSNTGQNDCTVGNKFAVELLSLCEFDLLRQREKVRAINLLYTYNVIIVHPYIIFV